MKKWLNLNVFEMKYDFTDTQTKLGLQRPYIPFNLSLIVNQTTDLYCTYRVGIQTKNLCTEFN